MLIIIIIIILILVLYYTSLFVSNKIRYSKAQKKILIEDFIGVMDLNLIILLLVSYDITRELRIPFLFQLSVLYLNYAALKNRKKKNLLCIILIISLIIFLLCLITHGLKNQGLWIRKLNGKKIKWNKKKKKKKVKKKKKKKKSCIGKEVSSNPQKPPKKNNYL